MKIHIVTGPFNSIFPNPEGAVEKMKYELAKEFDQQGHQVSIFSKKNNKKLDQINNGQIKKIFIDGFERSSSIIFDLLKDLVYSFRVLAKIPAADILLINVFWLPFLAQFSKKIRKTIVVIERVPKYQFFLYKKCDLFIAASTSIKETLIKQNPSLINKTIVITNPLDTSTYAPQYITPIKDIIYAGRIHKEKGINLLIDAFSKLQIEYPEATLTILGPHDLKSGGSGNTYLDFLKEKAKDLNVNFLAPIYDQKSFVEELSAHRIFCYPSQAVKGEACPLAPMEAMAIGLIPIVSDIPQFNDYISHHINGLIFKLSENSVDNLFNELKLLFNDEKLQQELRNQALKTIQNQSTNKIAELYLKHFSMLLNN